MTSSYTTLTKSKLQRMFDTCVIAEEKYIEIDNQVKQIVKGKERYYALSSQHNIPWYVTGIMHSIVCDCDFKTHLYNGDSLNGRTTNIPIGYPKRGRPPFTWEQGAEDVFLYYHLHKWDDWSIPGTLYNLEITDPDSLPDNETKSSKMWCFSNHFITDTTGETAKCGAAILLRRMVEKQFLPVEISYNSRLADIKKLGAEVLYMPNRSLPKTCELQRLMNISGACLRVDGRAGKFTANAYYALTGNYLDGDPESEV